MEQGTVDYYTKVLNLPQMAKANAWDDVYEHPIVSVILDKIYPERIEIPRIDINHLRNAIQYRLVNTLILHLKAKEALDNKSKIQIKNSEQHQAFGI